MSKRLKDSFYLYLLNEDNTNLLIYEAIGMHKVQLHNYKLDGVKLSEIKRMFKESLETIEKIEMLY